MSCSRFLTFRLASIALAPALLGAAAFAQTPLPKPPEPTQQLPPDEDAPRQAKPPVKPPAAGVQPPDSDLPPDEDAPAASEQHSFNPVKSKKSVSIGEFYFKKGNYGTAAERFLDATQWNEGNADAWLHLGEAEEKRGRIKPARSAYEKYLQLAGNTKSATEVKRKLDKLK